MKALPGLDVKRSISTSTLVYRKSWSYWLENVTISIAFSALFVVSIFTILVADMSSPNDRLFTFTALPLTTILSIYEVYRVWTQNILFVITSPFAAEENKRRILEFYQGRDYNMCRSSEACVIFDEAGEALNRNEVTRIFLFDGHNVFFAAVRENLPVLFKHLIIKKNLKKLFKL